MWCWKQGWAFSSSCSSLSNVSDPTVSGQRNETKWFDGRKTSSGGQGNSAAQLHTQVLCLLRGPVKLGAEIVIAAGILRGTLLYCPQPENHSHTQMSHTCTGVALPITTLRCHTASLPLQFCSTFQRCYN